jgi:hypothetical protein
VPHRLLWLQLGLKLCWLGVGALSPAEPGHLRCLASQERPKPRRHHRRGATLGAASWGRSESGRSDHGPRFDLIMRLYLIDSTTRGHIHNTSPHLVLRWTDQDPDPLALVADETTHEKRPAPLSTAGAQGERFKGAPAWTRYHNDESRTLGHARIAASPSTFVQSA